MSGFISRIRQNRYRRGGVRRAHPSRGYGPLTVAGLFLWAGSSLFLAGLSPIFHEALVIGQRAPVTIVAATEFQCVDLDRTRIQKQMAADAVLPVFTVNKAPLAAHLRTAEKLLRRIEAHRMAGDDPDAARADLAETIDLLGLNITPDEALSLAPRAIDANRMLTAIARALAAVGCEGITTAEDRNSAIPRIARDGQILLESTDSSAARIADADSLLTPSEGLARFVGLVAADAEAPRVAPDILRRLGEPWIAPNLAYAPALTDVRRADASARTEPVKMSVRSGTTLIEAGDYATAQTIEWLTAHERRLRERMTPADEWLGIIGRSGLLALTTLCGIALLQVLVPGSRRNRRMLALFVVLALCTAGLSRLVYLLVGAGLLPRALGDYLLPTGLGALLAALLAGRRFSIAIGAWSVLAVAIFAGNQFNVLFLGVAVVLAATIASRDTRKRERVFRAGLWMGLAGAAFVVVSTLLSRNPGPIVVSQGIAVLATGIVASLVALLVLPIFEFIFGLTSDIRLLELSDPSHPLLQRLAVEAPGTYHHSLMVANLAQAAADDIGAHGLLVRVCALFHDIGKLSTPRYFIENSQAERNPHDELSPQMSTLVILSHVKEGVALARAHHLPAPILDAIRQHHGTSVISYFYRRAVQTAGTDSVRGPTAPPPPDEKDFRYSGPQPQTKEMAILSLADAVEAASRATRRPSPSRIRGLVRDVIRMRLREGQLDECPLTLAELERVRTAFVFALTSMHHGRVVEPDHEGEHRQPAEPPDPDEAVAGADGLSDDESLVAEQADRMG